MIQASSRNLAGDDLLVEGKRISLKTETGASTKANRITTTKLCTTEKEPWDAPTLIARVLDHLGRYEFILMLRSIWERPLLHYALIGDMRRIIDDHIKDASRKRHCHVVADNRWAMYCRYVHPDDLALGSAPKSATVYCGIKDVSWLGVRVEIEHAFQEFAIFAIPNRRNRCVGRWRFGLFDKSYQSRLLFG
jgi:hypothetical protein